MARLSNTAQGRRKGVAIRCGGGRRRRRRRNSKVPGDLARCRGERIALARTIAAFNARGAAPRRDAHWPHPTGSAPRCGPEETRTADRSSPRRSDPVADRSRSSARCRRRRSPPARPDLPAAEAPGRWSRHAVGGLMCPKDAGPIAGHPAGQRPATRHRSGRAIDRRLAAEHGLAPAEGARPARSESIAAPTTRACMSRSKN